MRHAYEWPHSRELNMHCEREGSWEWGGNPQRQEHWACAKLCTKTRVEKRSLGILRLMERGREFKREGGVWPHSGDPSEPPNGESALKEGYLWLPGPFWPLFISSHPLVMLRPALVLTLGDSWDSSPFPDMRSVTLRQACRSEFWDIVWALPQGLMKLNGLGKLLAT